MSSTYSPNLRLELIGTGEQQGTWGTTTNTNLGTLLEEAIGGWVSVPVTDGADTTLTTVNGGADQSRNMIINLTGALTATRNVICPAIEKAYIVKNATTGGFAVTFKVSGQTGVSIPNGSTYILYVNGTDASLAGGTMLAQNANNVSITGGSITGITDLAVADGGTGASTAANARTNLGAAASGANTDITSLTLANTGLKIADTDASHYLSVVPGSNLTANRTMTITTGDAARTLTMSGDATISGTNTGDQNLFLTIAVSGQSDVVADSTTDTLTLAAGTGITLTTNATTDTITIAASGGAGVSNTKVTTFTSNGTYTKASNLIYAVVEVQGAGGGGGGTSGSASNFGAGGCAGAGGYSRKIYKNADLSATETVTIGAAGTGGASGNNSGANGGDSVFKAITASGGVAGGGGTASTTAGAIAGSDGGAATGGDINIYGGNGTPGMRFSGTAGLSGMGGTSHFGTPSSPANAAAGTTGNGYGQGGRGAATLTGVNRAGGDGGGGFVVITEFMSS